MLFAFIKKYLNPEHSVSEFYAYILLLISCVIQVAFMLPAYLDINNPEFGFNMMFMVFLTSIIDCLYFMVCDGVWKINNMKNLYLTIMGLFVIDFSHYIGLLLNWLFFHNSVKFYFMFFGMGIVGSIILIFLGIKKCVKDVRKNYSRFKVENMTV